jgi:hypothetical protein
MRNLILVFLILQSFISCESQSDKQVRNYFNSVCKKTEYNGELSEPKKWQNDVKIFVKGKKVDYLIFELTKIVSELNTIINPINLRIVNSESDANMVVFFGSEKEFNNFDPNSKKYTKNNYGVFVYYGSTYITRANVFVDIYRTETINAQKHLLREELTQSLGLFNDTYDYPNSIFYQGWTETTKYADIDVKLIKMLYN